MAVYEKARVRVDIDTNARSQSKDVNELNKKLIELNQIRKSAISQNDYKKVQQTEKEIRKVSKELKTLTNDLLSVDKVLKNLSGVSYNELNAAYTKTRKELRSLGRDTDEYKQKLTELNQIVAERNKANREMNIQSGTHYEKVNQRFLAIAGSVGLATAAIGGFERSLKQYVDQYSVYDDVLADVMKTTGMTREEVEALNKEFRLIDTRTSVNELNKIAEIGGRIGLAKEDILDFTRSIDIANVALGDSFSSADEIANMLGKLREAFTQTKNLQIDEAYLRIGSAINEVDANTNATAGNITQFARNLGSLTESFKPAVSEAIALGAAFEESSIEAQVASRAYGIVLRTAATDVEGFAKVMRQPIEEIKDLINSNPLEFFLQFSESLKGLNATTTAKILKELSLNADGVNKAIGAASDNTDRFREILELSNDAFEKNTSLLDEFNIKNNNTAAGLEKARNSLDEVKKELGEQFIPVITRSTEVTTGFFSAVSSGIKFLSENKALLLILVAAYSKYLFSLGETILLKGKELTVDKLAVQQLKIKNTLDNISLALSSRRAAAQLKQEAVHKTLTAQKLLENTATLQGIAADKASRNAINAETAAKLANQKATEAATRAQMAAKVAWSTMPWGAILTAVTALGVGIYKLATNTTAAEKAMKQFNEQSAKEEANARMLFSALEKTTMGSDEYRKILEKLKELYPDIISSMINEKGELEDIEKAYTQVTQAIQEKIAAQIKEQTITDAIAKSLENQRDQLGDIRRRLLRQGFGEEFISIFSSDVIKAINDGQEFDQILATLNDKFSEVDITGHIWGGIARDISSMVWANREMNQTVSDTEKLFSSILGISKQQTDEIQKQQKAQGNNSDDPLGDERDLEEYKKYLQERLKALQESSNKEKLIAIKAYQESQMSTADKEIYEKALQDIEFKFLQQKIDLYKKGSAERIAAELEYYNKFISIKEKENAEEAKIHQKRTDYFKELDDALDKYAEKNKDTYQQQIVDNTKTFQHLKDNAEKQLEQGVISREQYNEVILKLEEKRVENEKQIIIAGELDKIKKQTEIREKYGLISNEEYRQKSLDSLKKLFDEGLLSYEDFIKQSDQLKGLSSGLFTSDSSNDLALLDQALQDGLISYEDYLQAKENLFEKYGEKEEGNERKRRRAIQNILRESLSAISSMVQSSYERQFADLEINKNRELALVGDNADKRAEIEDKYGALKFELEKKQGRATMAVDMVELWAATALGAVQAWASSMQLGPIAGPIAAGILISLLTGAAALQSANLAKQQQALESMTYESSRSTSPSVTTTIPDVVSGYKEGGYTGDGYIYEPAGIVHRNEYVTPADVVEDPRSINALRALESIRIQKGHRKNRLFPKGKITDGFDEGGFTGYPSTANAAISPLLGVIGQALTHNAQALENNAEVMKKLEENGVMAFINYNQVTTENQKMTQIKSRNQK